MNSIETLQLLGFALVALALLIIAGTLATIVYRRRADELASWVAEQDQAAQDHAAEQERRRTMPARASVPPRPVSLDDGDTRPIQPRPCDRRLSTEPCNLLAGHPGACEITMTETTAACGNSLDHPAHHFIDYREVAGAPAEPEMYRRPCNGVRSGPHRRRA